MANKSTMKEARIYSGEKVDFLYVKLGKVDSCMEKNKIRTLVNTIAKINSKWIKHLNVRPDTKKFIEENSLI